MGFARFVVAWMGFYWVCKSLDGFLPGLVRFWLGFTRFGKV